MFEPLPKAYGCQMNGKYLIDTDGKCLIQLRCPKLDDSGNPILGEDVEIVYETSYVKSPEGLFYSNDSAWKLYQREKLRNIREETLTDMLKASGAKTK